jgi:hypothetical protein
MFHEVIITPRHDGFGAYRTVVCDVGWEVEQDLLDDIGYSGAFTVFELGVDELPEGLDDIRGKIYNEPERVFGFFYEDDPNQEPYYFGITERNRE